MTQFQYISIYFAQIAFHKNETGKEAHGFQYPHFGFMPHSYVEINLKMSQICVFESHMYADRLDIHVKTSLAPLKKSTLVNEVNSGGHHLWSHDSCQWRNGGWKALIKTCSVNVGLRPIKYLLRNLVPLFEHFLYFYINAKTMVSRAGVANKTDYLHRLWVLCYITIQAQWKHVLLPTFLQNKTKNNLYIRNTAGSRWNEI